MKKLMIGLAALFTLGGLNATSAAAQDHGRHGGFDRGGAARGGFERSDFGVRGGRGGEGYGGPGYEPRDYAPRGYAPRDYAPRDYAPRDYTPRAYAPPSNYRGGYRGYSRGQILPPAYWNGQVANPRAYHLRRPPAGYSWITVGPNAYLTQRSTGMILDTAPLY